jgi:hypothetical protein
LAVTLAAWEPSYTGDFAPPVPSTTRPLRQNGRAVHTHYRGGVGGGTELSAHGAATYTAPASLVLQRRPRSDTAVLGTVNQQGGLAPYSPRQPLSVARVRACRAQGTRRLIVAPHTEMDEAAKAALVEGPPVAIIPLDRLTVMLGECFS